MRKLALWILPVVALGCGEFRTGGNIGGANLNAKRAGNVPGGIAVREGDVAISPRGNFYVTLKGDRLVMGDVAAQDAQNVDGLPRPDRLAFWNTQADGFVVLSQDRDFSGNPRGNQKLVSFDRTNNRVLWSKESSRQDRRLDISPDGSRIVLAGQDVQILDALTGDQVGSVATASPVRDVDFLASGSRILVTQEHSASSSSIVSVNRIEDGSQVCQTDSHNCAGDAVVSGDESRIFMSPTLCDRAPEGPNGETNQPVDPISVISLSQDNCTTERIMPGFGPVAMAPDGKTLVAFIDRDAPPPPNETVPSEVTTSRTRYHLMFVDPVTLDYSTTPSGDDLPRFAFTVDGAKLLVDEPMNALGNIRILDVAAKSFRNVRGPPIKLNAFTLSPDGARAFVVDAQLFHLDIGSGWLKPVSLSVPPKGVNLTTDGLTLLVTRVSDNFLTFFDALRQRETGRVQY